MRRTPKRIAIFVFLSALSVARADEPQRPETACGTLAVIEASVSQLWTNGDPAMALARRSFGGETLSGAESEALQSRNSDFSMALSDVVELLDHLGKQVSAIGDQAPQVEKPAHDARGIVVASLLLYLKPRAMRYLYSAMSTVNCPMSWEDGYDPSCSVNKITPYYISKVEVARDVRINIGSAGDAQSVRDRIENPETEERVVEHYTALKQELVRQLPGMARTIRSAYCPD